MPAGPAGAMFDSPHHEETLMNAHPKTAGIATLACMAASLCFAVPAHAADDAGWQWMVAPYGWLASIESSTCAIARCLAAGNVSICSSCC